MRRGRGAYGVPLLTPQPVVKGSREARALLGRKFKAQKPKREPGDDSSDKENMKLPSTEKTAGSKSTIAASTKRRPVTLTSTSGESPLIKTLVSLLIHPLYGKKTC